MKNSSITSEEFSLEKWMRNPLEEIQNLDNLDRSDNFNQLNEINSEQLEEGFEEELDPTQVVHQEFVDSKVITLKQRRIQGNIYYHWRNFNDSHQQRGQVYTDVPCIADGEEWQPSIAYLTPQLLKHYGEPDIFPQSFPLIAEIVSLTDLAEEVIAKAQMYLHSGSEEVWLIFPENRWIIVTTSSQQLVFTSGEIIYTQRVLRGFTAAVDDLLV
ncbi:Uma2 family endonuclease [Mastigocoleus testarum]|uniref:Uma2 family endonuclease n=1 Tax=Mastigocoleus testarum TaxID=996925 RepID=UPI0004085B1B|nr:Uma2 family endonuclease [Mastigocoleus testarum]